ncbi:MAG: hypothetical protein M1823_002677 [Watsoniomyces obsoletus]|nr:MAG: hypothetical protein M1823_002677 [Watsoniomyces obsoletus]
MPSRGPSNYFAPSLFASTSGGTTSRPTTSSSSSHSNMPQGDRSRVPESHVHGTTGMDGLTCEEFNTLPPVVRRKFFSSVERLRFAHASTDTTPPPRPSTQGDRKPTVSTPNPRGSTAGGEAKAITAPAGSTLSQIDAHWFMGLPEKVKTRHFTKEEQAFLRDQYGAQMLAASEDARYGRRRAMSNPSVSPRASRRSSVVEYREEKREFEGPRGMAMNNDQEDDPLRFFETDDDLDLRLKLDDYHAYISPDDNVQALPADGRSRKPSFHRTAFYTYTSRISGRSWSLPTPPSRRPSRDQGVHDRKGSTASALSSIGGLPLAPTPSATTAGTVGVASSRDATVSVDAGATYYRDPEARLKMRVYLASPQKFDEAIEFGFPSVEQALGNIHHSRQHSRQHSRKASMKSVGGMSSQNGFKSFLEDGDEGDEEDEPGEWTFEGKVQEDDEDSESESDDGEDSQLDKDEDGVVDETSTPDTDQPMTPVELDTAFRSPHRLPYAAKLHSTDSTTPRPIGVPRPRKFESYAFAPASAREMTLRITLTRPDLQINPAGATVEDGNGGIAIAPGVMVNGTTTTGKWHRRRASTTPSLWFPREKNDPLMIESDPLEQHNTSQQRRKSSISIDAGGYNCLRGGGGDVGFDATATVVQGRVIVAGLDQKRDEGGSSSRTSHRSGEVGEGKNGGMKKFWKKMVSTTGGGRSRGR